MRPRIQRSAVLIAKSNDVQVKTDATTRCTPKKSNKPYILVFGKRFYIYETEIESYCDQGFTVFYDK